MAARPTVRGGGACKALYSSVLPRDLRVLENPSPAPDREGFCFFFNRFCFFCIYFFYLFFCNFLHFFSHDKKLQHIIPQKKDEE